MSIGNYIKVPLFWMLFNHCSCSVNARKEIIGETHIQSLLYLYYTPSVP